MLAGIPLLVLIGLILVATLRNRGGGDLDPVDVDDEFDVDTTHDTAAEAEALRLAGSEDHGRVQLADSYGRPSGSALYGLGGFGRDPFEEKGDDGDEFSELEPEPDDSDTAPTPIASESDSDSGRHSAIQLDDPETDLHEPEPVAAPAGEVGPSDAAGAQTAIHLPLDDPYLAPTGYPIKADTKSGLYWEPESDLYDHIPADIYFVTEQFARANGFVKAD